MERTISDSSNPPPPASNTQADNDSSAPSNPKPNLGRGEAMISGENVPLSITITTRGVTTTLTAPASSRSSVAAGKRKAPMKWTKEEDDRLRVAVAKIKASGSGKLWKEVAEKVGTRNHMQCLQRWMKVSRKAREVQELA